MTENDPRDPGHANPFDAVPLSGGFGSDLAHIETAAGETPAGGLERAENAIELKEVEGLSQGRIILRRFLHHRGAMIALVVLAAVVILAYSSVGVTIFGLRIPGWWKYQYSDITDTVNNLRPTLTLWPLHIGDHPFGQDEVGHDVFSEVMRGAQQSIMIIVVIGVVSTAIGVVIGSVAGYFGGIVDSLLMRLTDLFIIVPIIILAAVVGHYASGSGPFVLALMLGVLSWTSLARLVRGEVLTLRSLEFVEAAKVAGASHRRIIFKHILPNAAGVIIVSMTLTMAAAILLEAALGYLGLGVQPPDVSLGELISAYQTSFGTRPWLFWYTGTLIVIIALTVNFIGDGLRDAFDPRQRRKLSRKAVQEASGARPTAEQSE
jgi:peptide/nickel transport system permease protein